MSRTVSPRYHAVDTAFYPSRVAALGATGIGKANDFRLSTMWIGLGMVSELNLKLAATANFAAFFCFPEPLSLITTIAQSCITDGTGLTCQQRIWQ